MINQKQFILLEAMKLKDIFRLENKQLKSTNRWDREVCFKEQQSCKRVRADMVTVAAESKYS